MRVRISELEVKKLLSSLLKEFDTCCKEMGVNYFLAYGTLLGAVRHKGFIPWDNDIDVCMFRSEVDKFIHAFKSNEKFDIKGEPFTDGATSIYDRFRFYYKNTVITDDDTEDVGLSLDIFVMDYEPDAAYLKMKMMFLEKIVLLKSIGINEGRSLAKTIILFPLKLISNHIPGQWIEKEYIKCIRSGNIKQGKNIKIVNDPYGKNPFDGSNFKESEPFLFEGISCPVPIGYDKILNQFYGDYMTLPPEEKRVKQQIEAYWIKPDN